MEALQYWLQYWLLLVAALRLLSVVLGYKDPMYFRRHVFTLQPPEVTPLAARLFSVWTVVTCCCCVVCALNIHERAIMLLTVSSFYVALAFFVVEYAVYHTIQARFLATIVAVTVISIVWMTPNIPAK